MLVLHGLNLTTPPAPSAQTMAMMDIQAMQKKRIDELTMIVRRLARALEMEGVRPELVNRAKDYLQRHHDPRDILRDIPT